MTFSYYQGELNQCTTTNEAEPRKKMHADVQRKLIREIEKSITQQYGTEAKMQIVTGFDLRNPDKALLVKLTMPQKTQYMQAIVENGILQCIMPANIQDVFVAVTSLNGVEILEQVTNQIAKMVSCTYGEEAEWEYNATKKTPLDLIQGFDEIPIIVYKNGKKIKVSIELDTWYNVRAMHLTAKPTATRKKVAKKTKETPDEQPVVQPEDEESAEEESTDEESTEEESTEESTSSSVKDWIATHQKQLNDMVQTAKVKHSDVILIPKAIIPKELEEDLLDALICDVGYTNATVTKKGILVEY